MVVATFGAVLAWQVPPGIASLDAGDFATASTVLGVPHATGFPVQTAAGHALTWLPWAGLAGRVGLWSALCMAVAFAGILDALRTAVPRDGGVPAAVAAATTLVLLCSDTMALHAVVPEVYALQLALVALGLAAGARLHATGDPRWAMGIALLAGLAVANHATGRLAAPIWLVVAWRGVPVQQRARATGIGLLIGCLAVCSYGYLAAAALRDPVHNWGDPSTVARWWAHITGAEIRTAFADQMRPSLASAVTSGTVFARQLWQGLGLCAPLGVIALGAGWVHRLPCAPAAGALVLVDAGYAVLLNPMGLRDAQNGQVATLLLAVAAAALLAAAATRRGGARPASTVAAVVAVTLAFVPAWGTPYRALDRDWSADDVGSVALAKLGPDGLLTTLTDSQTAATLYLQHAVDARPDALVFGRHALSSTVALDGVTRHAPFALVDADTLSRWRAEGNAAVAPRAAAVLEAHAGRRDIAWEAAMTTDDLPPSVQLVHRWPYGALAPAGATVDECAPTAVSYCGAPPLVTYAETARGDAGAYSAFGAAWLASQWSYRGARLVRAGDCPAALAWFDAAATLDPRASNHRTNRAVCLSDLGDHAAALDEARAALALDPSSGAARRIAVASAEAIGDAALAARLRRWSPTR